MSEKNSQKDIGFIMAKLESMHESINDVKTNISCFESDLKETQKQVNINTSRIGNIYIYIGIISTVASAVMGVVFKLSGSIFDNFLKKL